MGIERLRFELSPPCMRGWRVSLLKLPAWLKSDTTEWKGYVKWTAGDKISMQKLGIGLSLCFTTDPKHIRPTSWKWIKFADSLSHSLPDWRAEDKLTARTELEQPTLHAKLTSPVPRRTWCIASHSLKKFLGTECPKWSLAQREGFLIFDKIHQHLPSVASLEGSLDALWSSHNSVKNHRCECFS